VEADSLQGLARDALVEGFEVDRDVREFGHALKENYRIAPKPLAGLGGLRGPGVSHKR
jgi:hypothetical protein